MTMFPSWQDTFVALHRATTLEELWTVLLVPHGIRSTAAWEEPFGLFRQFHAAGAEHAATTAALLCTDHRWRKGANRLIGQLAESDALDDTALDRLSDWFLGDDLLMTAPRRSFPIPLLIVDPAAQDPIAARSRLGVGDRGRAGERPSIAVRRSIWPPLRRWAAHHVVERNPTRWTELIKRADVLSGTGGAAIAAGVMDGADSIERGERIDAVAVGLAWGSGTVRLAALPRLAKLHGIGVAIERAHGDPSAKVRAWATKAASTPPLTQAHDADAGDGEYEGSSHHTSDRTDPPTLFDV